MSESDEFRNDDFLTASANIGADFTLAGHLDVTAHTGSQFV